jgi:6-pyruvoyltetrahydropterin/6-carboxytetrahydropterin synthase
MMEWCWILVTLSASHKSACGSEPWDHAFLVAKEDEKLVASLASLPNHKTVIMEHVPTVENLSQYSLLQFCNLYSIKLLASRLQPSAVRSYETPNCWAVMYTTNK